MREGGHAVDTETRAQVQQACAQRAAFYRFLASIFLYELTDQQIEELSQLSVPAGEGSVQKGYATMREYLRHRDTGTRQELAVDYARLFLGAGNYETITAPPYESVYTSPDRILMQEARDAAMKHYRAFGLALPEDNTTPEDHIGFELQFMATVIERCGEAAAAGDAAGFRELVAEQRAFFEQHMRDWFFNFASDIDKYRRTAFYGGVADLLRGLLEVEEPVLDELEAIAAEGSS